MPTALCERCAEWGSIPDNSRRAHCNNSIGGEGRIGAVCDFIALCQYGFPVAICLLESISATDEVALPSANDIQEYLCMVQVQTISSCVMRAAKSMFAIFIVANRQT